MFSYFRKTLTACLCAGGLLAAAGCASKDGQILMPYVSDGAGSASVLAAGFDPVTVRGFADGLAVADPSKTGQEQARTEGVDAQEIFLAGLDDPRMIQAFQIYKTMPPASLTKILTALVALRSGKELDQMYTVGDEVVISISDAQVCGLMPGDSISLRTLLYAMLIYSGNDTANAVASIVGDGDIPAFCQMMNEEAARLGAVQTHFSTPNGLDDPNHYTSAYDLYLIFRECLNYDLFRDAISQSGYNASWVRDGETFSRYFESTNRYLTGESVMPENVTVIGGKTGTTDKAGLCLILYAKDRQDAGYISVLLGSPDKDTLYRSMTNLFSYVNK